MVKILGYIFSALFIVGCSGLETSEAKKRRQMNWVIEPIKRKGADEDFFIPEPQQVETPLIYPWEDKYIGKLPRITKEFFRCKGNPLSPPLEIISATHLISYQLDCGGIEEHSLPIREGEEFIYPILITLLNEVQKISHKKVIITSGHRCPTHNLYVDRTQKSRTSKHLMGAEVDFYVEGIERHPLSVVQILEKFYEDDEEFGPLKPVEGKWTNREVTLSCYGSKERRNGDNLHPFPYLTIEVKYDRQTKRPVHFSWNQGYRDFYRNRS
jgi:hypothetical protein